MRKVTIALLVMVLTLILVSPTLADMVPSAGIGGQIIPPPLGSDPVIWDNVPNSLRAHGWSSETGVTGGSQSADDFVLSDAGAGGKWMVTDLHWWGVAFPAYNVSNATGFNIRIYEDDGTGRPTGHGTTDPSGTAVQTWTVSLAQSNETFLTQHDTYNYYSYDLDLPTPFLANLDTHYWISIQAINTYPPQWGWVNAWDSQQLSGFAQGGPWYTPRYWNSQPYAGGDLDMAFQLTGYQVPAPGAVVLGAVGLGLVGWVRRRAS